MSPRRKKDPLSAKNGRFTSTSEGITPRTALGLGSLLLLLHPWLAAEVDDDDLPR